MNSQGSARFSAHDLRQRPMKAGTTPSSRRPKTRPAEPMTAERRSWVRLHVGAILASGLLALACTWFEFGQNIFAAPHLQKGPTTLKVGVERLTYGIRSAVRKPTPQKAPAVRAARTRSSRRRSAPAVHSVKQPPAAPVRPPAPQLQGDRPNSKATPSAGAPLTSTATTSATAVVESTLQLPSLPSVSVPNPPPVSVPSPPSLSPPTTPALPVGP
jgi:hypothetical protein